jgi:sRNA-binding protein
MDTDLSDEAIVDILSQVLLAEGIDWSSVSPARLRTMLAHETGGSSKVSEKRMKGVKAAAVASALSRNVAAVQATMQLDHDAAAAAEEEKERLRVQRKSNKQKRRDQARQETVAESAEPGSGAPDTGSAPATTAAGVASDGSAAAMSTVCSICFTDPVTVTLVHANEVGHRCVCVSCADILKTRKDTCPVCREPVVVFMKNSVDASVSLG